jgi:signal transduction histidine kinase
MAASAALPIESSARVRSRIAFAAGVILLVFAGAEALRGGPALGAVLSARLVWALALLAASHLLLHGEERSSEALITACFVLSVVALTVLTVMGGSRSAAGAYLITAPLVFAALLPGAVRALLVASVVTALAAAGSEVLLGHGAGDAAMNALRAIASGVVAVLGAVSAERIRRAEIALAEERARALEALERSERRQAEVEGLAAAGSKAAGVAHDMSNPLASIRCNLDWLRETAEEGRLESDREEAVQVIRETRECLDRLGQNLQEFRTVARSARALATRVDELAGASAPLRALPTDRASGE